MASELHRASAGMFDVTVPTQGTGGPAVELLAGHRVRLGSPEVRIDLGGIAKGFAVDRAIDRLRDHGLPVLWALHVWRGKRTVQGLSRSAGARQRRLPAQP